MTNNDCKNNKEYLEQLKRYKIAMLCDEKKRLESELKTINGQLKELTNS